MFGFFCPAAAYVCFQTLDQFFCALQHRFFSMVENQSIVNYGEKNQTLLRVVLLFWNYINKGCLCWNLYCKGLAVCEHITIIFCFGNWAPLDYFSVVMVLLTIKVNTFSGCSRCLFSKMSVNPAPSTTVEVEQMVFNTVQMPCFYFLNKFFLFVLEQTRSTMQHT